MASSSFILIFFLSLITLSLQHAQSATIVVDGVSEWNDPTVHIGDSIIFEHKYHYNLYIFKNEGAFKMCNFSQATLLSKPSSTSFTWKPSRPGSFYFSFNNGSALPCKQGQKLSIKVPAASARPPTISANAPEISPVSSPAPISCGIISSSPAHQFPSLPSQSASSPSPASSPATFPTLEPDKGGGIPFINSNPAVPLPTGEVDSATIRPLPTSNHAKKVVGLSVQMSLCFWVILML